MHGIVEDSIDEEEDGPFVIGIAIAKLLAGSIYTCNVIAFVLRAR